MMKRYKIAEGKLGDIIFTDEMINDNVAIETIYLDACTENDFKSEMIISLKYLSNYNARDYVLYWDRSLAPIEVNRIVKDIILTYEARSSLNDFIDEIEYLSIQFTTSDMQSKSENRLEIIDEVQEVLKIAKGEITHYEN